MCISCFLCQFHLCWIANTNAIWEFDSDLRQEVQELKPIFHWKLGWYWLPNANEMSTNNMKCTWPIQKLCVGDPAQPIFHWFALGFALGVAQILFFALGVTPILAFLDTNMLVYPKQNFALGVLANARTQRKCFCIVVEYRL